VSGPLDPKEVRHAVLGLAGAMAAAGDQAQAMTDEELGRLLLSGGYTTIEVHEAGRRLADRHTEFGTSAEEKENVPNPTDRHSKDILGRDELGGTFEGEAP
jgi:hypothetical protein